MNKPFCMSIETTAGVSHLHGFHLGTDEQLARKIVEEKFSARLIWKLPTYTIALTRNRRMVDVFDGKDWHNSLGD